ncbi:unnamed protein product [Closterium sp. NIES-53]
MAERQCKTTVQALRTDRGGEFLGHDFTLFLDGKGIIHDLTCPYTSEQNGMAEREMRSIVEAVRMMLLHMGVQHHWWHLALAQAVWVRNRVEHASLPSGVTPYELAFRRKPDVSMVRVWGCMLQYMVPQSQRGGKLAPKARWGLHLGWKAWHQQEHGGRSMPYVPLPSLFPITLEEAEEEEVVAPPAMPYVPTSVPTPPPPSVYPRLPDSLRSVRDHFLSLDPTSLTFDLLEQHLLAAETSAVAVGVARGTPCPPFFEGCSPSPLAPSYASAAAADVSIAEDVRVDSASAKRRSSKGKGGGGGSGSGRGGSGSSGGGRSGGGGGGGTGGGSGGSGGGGGGSGGSGGSGGGGTGGGGTGAQRVGSGGD